MFIHDPRETKRKKTNVKRTKKREINQKEELERKIWTYVHI